MHRASARLISTGTRLCATVQSKTAPYRQFAISPIVLPARDIVFGTPQPPDSFRYHTARPRVALGRRHKKELARLMSGMGDRRVFRNLIHAELRSALGHDIRHFAI
jgi:hypothetical protein